MSSPQQRLSSVGNQLAVPSAKQRLLAKNPDDVVSAGRTFRYKQATDHSLFLPGHHLPCAYTAHQGPQRRLEGYQHRHSPYLVAHRECPQHNKLKNSTNTHRPFAKTPRSTPTSSKMSASVTALLQAPPTSRAPPSSPPDSPSQQPPQSATASVPPVSSPSKTLPTRSSPAQSMSVSQSEPRA